MDIKNQNTKLKAIKESEEYKYKNKTIDKGIGRRLRLKRGERLQEDVVEKLKEYYIDVSETDISKYENGKMYPRLNVLMAMSKVYGVSMDYLCFGKEDVETRAIENTIDILSDVTKALDKIIKELKRKISCKNSK